MSREELRADLLDDHGYCVNCGEDAEDCECGFEEFIDATVAAGWRKPILDDATVERAAKRLWIEDPEATIGFWGNIMDGERDYYRRTARAVLAAAVEAGQ